MFVVDKSKGTGILPTLAKYTAVSFRPCTSPLTKKKGGTLQNYIKSLKTYVVLAVEMI